MKETKITWMRRKGDTREEERVCLVKRRALLWPYKYDKLDGPGRYGGRGGDAWARVTLVAGRELVLRAV